MILIKPTKAYFNQLKDLKEFGGHIGYSIKPSARRKGYVKKALSQLLDLYKDKYSEILIMCENDNVGSNKTILANDGILINQTEKFGLKINRYRINISKNTIK